MHFPLKSQDVTMQSDVVLLNLRLLPVDLLLKVLQFVYLF